MFYALIINMPTNKRSQGCSGCTCTPGWWKNF